MHIETYELCYVSLLLSVKLELSDLHAYVYVCQISNQKAIHETEKITKNVFQTFHKFERQSFCHFIFQLLKIHWSLI